MKFCKKLWLFSHFVFSLGFTNPRLRPLLHAILRWRKKVRIFTFLSTIKLKITLIEITCSFIGILIHHRARRRCRHDKSVFHDKNREDSSLNFVWYVSHLWAFPLGCEMYTLYHYASRNCVMNMSLFIHLSPKDNSMSAEHRERGSLDYTEFMKSLINQPNGAARIKLKTSADSYSSN